MPRRGACSVPRDHPTPAPDSPPRRRAAEVKMVGYITVAHGAAQRLSEKWRHFICTLLSSLFCTSPRCVGVSVSRVWSCYGSAPSWWSGAAPLRLVGSCSRFSWEGKESLSALLSCHAANLGSCSWACWHVSSVKYPLVRHVPLSSSSSPWLARDLQSVWRVRTLLVVDYARELGVRGALFLLFAAVACFSCLN